MIVAFIDAMVVEGFAVELICAVLTAEGCQVAARTYRSWKQPARKIASRTVSDAVVIDGLLASKGTPEGLYGRRKMTAHLRRSGLEVSHHTVDRLMRDLGLNGVRRGKKNRTTIPSPDAQRPADLLERDFTATAPNTCWVADFTYVRTWAGFVYVAFIVDVFAQRIIAWHVASTKTTDLVSTCLRMATWQRAHEGHPVLPGQLVHHHDAGSQPGLNRSSQHLDHGGVDGASAGVDGYSDGAPGDAFAGAAAVSPGDGAGVLGQDRPGDDQRGRWGRGWRVGAGRVAVVP